MRRAAWLLILCVMMGSLGGCGTGRKDPTVFKASEAPVASAGVGYKVVDVTNSTREVFDVDVIGLLWNALDGRLKQRGLAWTPESTAPPIAIEAYITEYRKGNLALRPFYPPLGKTVLTVRCDIKDQGRVIATIESSHAISLGSDTFTWAAWRKIFDEVSQDIVNKIAARR
ncbi:MAG: hypothetical protein ACLGPL_02110 [Acidobacteriota bacterium]